MISTETTAAEASRRAELLTARYAALTEGDPNVDYHWHREASEEQLPGADSVPAALGAGRARFGDLVRLAADDRTFQLWRLRLEHPLWWIGGPVVDTTAFLAEIVGDLAGESSGSGSGSHPGVTGLSRCTLVRLLQGGDRAANSADPGQARRSAGPGATGPQILPAVSCSPRRR